MNTQKPDAVELLPCPFCGGEALEIEHPPHKHHFVNWPDHPGSWTIECVKCQCGMIDDTQENVRAAWNRRPIAPAPPTTQPSSYPMPSDVSEQAANFAIGTHPHPDGVKVPESDLLPGLKEALLWKPNTPQLENAMTYAWESALKSFIRAIEKNAAAPSPVNEERK